jgi:hypothetical protein
MRSRILRGATSAAAFCLFIALSINGAVPTANAAGSSAVTISWAGDNAASVQKYQPVRDTGSSHYADFKNLKVSVDQTSDLVDQTVTVNITGMPGATSTVRSTGGSVFEFGSDFVQAMQCWGDPTATDFYKNCQWGAFQYESSNAPSVLIGEETGVGNANGRGTTYTKSYFSKAGELDVPFRAVSGKEYSTGATDSTSRDAPILDVFSAANTNERTVPVGADGATSFEFETQTAAAQPYLGCGNPKSATGTSCYLVLVPRGEHNSESHLYCTTNVKDYPKAQQGSPVNPNCDYWGNRIVVPLNFRATTDSCAVGGNEVGLVGTELIQGAFESWQKALCRSKQEAFSFTSSADRVARDQLVAGQTNAAFTMRPVTADYLSSAVDQQTLADRKITYAPVAVASVGIAFVGNYAGNSYSQVKLSPRLIAKLLTNSYEWESGLGKAQGVGGAGVASSVASSVYTLPAAAWQSPVRTLRTDPEFIALNPDVHLIGSGSLVLVGPNPADSIAQLWRYLQADDKARAFLAGDADNVLAGDSANAGMTINPYYLPKGHKNAKVPAFVEKNLATAAGGTMPTLVPDRDSSGDYVWEKVGLTTSSGDPLCLCDASVDTLNQADQTLLPRMLDTAGQPRYDLSQVVPYASSYAAAATRVFRVDSGSKTTWEANVSLPNGGTYRSDGQQRWTSAFLNGFTSSADAARLALPMASLQVPNRSGVFVSPTQSAMTAAVVARSTSSVSGFSQVPDAGSLSATAYPLTGIVYLAVSGTAKDATRRSYADLIDYAVSDTGQTVGSAIGQLPQGYAPLPTALRSQAKKMAAQLRISTDTTTTTGTQSSAAAAPAAAAANTAAAAPSTTGAQSADTRIATQDSINGPPAYVVGGALLTSVAGLAVGPYLMRRRRIYP